MHHVLSVLLVNGVNVFTVYYQWTASRFFVCLTSLMRKNLAYCKLFVTVYTALLFMSGYLMNNDIFAVKIIMTVAVILSGMSDMWSVLPDLACKCFLNESFHVVLLK